MAAQFESVDRTHLPVVSARQPSSSCGQGMQALQLEDTPACSGPKCPPFTPHVGDRDNYPIRSHTPGAALPCRAGRDGPAPELPGGRQMVVGQDRAGERGGLGHCLDLGATCVTVALLLTLRGSLGSLNPESPDTPFSLCPGVPPTPPPMPRNSTGRGRARPRSQSPPTVARSFPETVLPAPPCSNDPDFKCRLKKKKALEY